jgi:hypothetical protein
MSRTMKPKTYELDLLENGLDFVKSGLEIYFRRKTPKDRAHKYAILHVFSGMLLLLKERLARIRPSLIFVCEAHAGEPGAKTTDYHLTFHRLEEYGVIIDPKARTILDKIRILRNTIEHYHVELSIEDSRVAIGEMITFIHGFCINELNVFIQDKLSRKALDHFYDLKGVCDNMSDFMSKDAAAEAEAEERYFQEFQQRYAAMSPDDLLRHASVGGARLVRCPGCDENSLLYLEVGACTNPACRATYQLNTCSYCSETTTKSGYFCVCDSCRSG